VENILKQIHNPEARRIKFKDERKLTVGMSKKDIMNCRGKVKNAFYNCFAMILRFQQRNNLNGSNDFKEVHVKIFNTGKMEIPGIVNKELLEDVKKMILEILRTYSEVDNELDEIDFVENEKEDSVLINSNFNCGFYINREKLHSILRSDKYRIESAFDPCSYPGVKCKFYFNHEIGYDTKLQTGTVCKEDRVQKMSELNDNKRYTEVSFMVFRTGSCLVVGNCSESILNFIYEFIKMLLYNEYSEIKAPNESGFTKVKKTKVRTKSVSMTLEYWQSNCTK
jgi:TATA-box binding protein (TBP) (component of TFIID and TFIIIB)